MRDPIEHLNEEQLVHIVVLLEEDKKNEALVYIVKNSSLTEQQARDVIAAILMEHDAALQQQTSGPRFTDDLPEQQVETGNLTDSIAISIPRQNDQLSDSPASPITTRYSRIAGKSGGTGICTENTAFNLDCCRHCYFYPALNLDFGLERNHS